MATAACMPLLPTCDGTVSLCGSLWSSWSCQRRPRRRPRRRGHGLASCNGTTRPHACRGWTTTARVGTQPRRMQPSIGGGTWEHPPRCRPIRVARCCRLQQCKVSSHRGAPVPISLHRPPSRLPYRWRICEREQLPHTPDLHPRRSRTSSPSFTRIHPRRRQRTGPRTRYR